MGSCLIIGWRGRSGGSDMVMMEGIYIEGERWAGGLRDGGLIGTWGGGCRVCTDSGCV